MASAVVALVVAGGSGVRFGAAGGKQLAPVAGLPVLSWSIKAIDAAGVDAIVVACDPARQDEYREAAVEPLDLRARTTVVGGGATRQESVAACLREAPDDAEIVLVHDGARPLISSQTIRGAIQALIDSPGTDGVVVAHPLVDTVKIVSGLRVVETPDRSSMWAVQTPQVFRAQVLRAAMAAARADSFMGTDDASLVERYGGVVEVFEGPRDNIKLTVPEDRLFVEAVLEQRATGEAQR